jgi:hypothetical protein
MGEALTEVTAATESRVNFGLEVFPYPDEDNTQCYPGGVYLDIAPNNAANISAVLGGGPDDMGTQLGTPTASALRTAKTYLDGIDDGLNKYVLLATDGAPNCNTDLDATTCVCSGGGGSCYHPWCLDDAESIAAAEELYAAGYKVFVMGMGDGMKWADVMNGIAEAGGTTEYIPADTTNFSDILLEIVSGLIDCNFKVDWSTLAEDAAPEPDMVNFYCKQSATEEEDPSNLIPFNDKCKNGDWGWTWQEGSEDTVEMCDGTCDAVRGGYCPVVSATFGCISVPVL